MSNEILMIKGLDHYAIIPTGKLPPSGLSSDAAKLYDLIARQFLASFHPESVWKVEKRRLQNRAKISSRKPEVYRYPVGVR